MEFLRRLFGSVATRIVRLAVAIGVLVAAYLLIVKPALHTTEHVDHAVDRQITHSLREAERAVAHAPTKILHCVRDSNGDVKEMRRCAAKVAP